MCDNVVSCIRRKRHRHVSSIEVQHVPTCILRMPGCHIGSANMAHSLMFI